LQLSSRYEKYHKHKHMLKAAAPTRVRE